MKAAEDLDYLSYEKLKLKEISQFLGEEKGQSKFLYPKFTEEEVQRSEGFVYFKTILFIGQTGAGKTTSINYFLNFVLGVKFEDNFRFLLINEKTVSGTQAVSQTQDVSIYYVKPFNGNQALRIIDTPGLGDTRGLQQDKINTEKITQLFTKQIDTITSICFVVKSSDNRLVESFNLIIEAFLNMFGKDIVKIFVCLITHWDGIEEEPNAIQTLSFKGDLNNRGCHISSLISSIQEPWFFLINNSPFQSKLKTKSVNAAWKDSIDTFNDFFEQKVVNRQDASLMMTKEVLKHRKNMECIISEFNKNLKCGLDQLKNIREIYNLIQNMEQQIVASQNFTINQTRHCKKTVPTRNYVTNCNNCEKTCSLYGRCVTSRINRRTMRRRTTQCYKCRCNLSSHTRSLHKYVMSYETEQVQLSDLREKYYSLNSEKSQKEQILNGKRDEYFTYLAEQIYQLQDFMFSIKELKTKAVTPPGYDSEDTYLEHLIKEEKESKKINSSETLKALSNLQICLKLIKSQPNYQFEGGTNLYHFSKQCKEKVQEAYQKRIFTII